MGGGEGCEGSRRGEKVGDGGGGGAGRGRGRRGGEHAAVAGIASFIANSPPKVCTLGKRKL